MKRFLLLLIPCVALAGTEPINVDTLAGHVKETSSGTGSALKPFNFTDVHTDGLLLEELADVLLTSPTNTQVLAFDSISGKWINVAAGGGSGIGTVTSFSAGTLSPLFTTSVANSTTTPALSFILSNAGAHTFFANNTGSSGLPSFTSFVARTDYWDTTVFPGGNNTGLVPPVSAAVPPCTRFLDENGVWQCAGADGVAAAPEDAHYVTTQAEAGLSAEFSLGTLADGLLKHTVAAGVSTPARAIPGTDYTDNAFKTLAVSGQSDVVADSAADTLTFAAGSNITLTTNATTDTVTIAAAGSAQTHAVTLVADNSGTALTTGTKNPVKIPYGGTLTGWLLVGKPSGSVTVDIFRSADGAGLPVTSIVGAGTKPSLSTAVENSSTSFTSWTSTTLTAKDNLAVSLSGITTATYCALTLYYQ